MIKKEGKKAAPLVENGPGTTGGDQIGPSVEYGPSPDASRPDDLWERIASVLKDLAEHTSTPHWTRSQRTRLENLLLTLVTSQGDAVDLADPQPPSATSAKRLGNIARRLRRICKDIPSPHELVLLDSSIAVSLRRTLIDAAKDVEKLSTIANARKVSHRRSEVASDLAIRNLAECWKVATGRFPNASTRQIPIPTSGTGAVRVVDSGQFALWAKMALKQLRPEHHAVADDRKAPVADALKRLRNPPKV